MKNYTYTKNLWNGLLLSNEIIKSLPKGNADLVNQLKRAALSVPLNVAEGAGKISIADKKSFYAIARSSALECAAILDALAILEITKLNNLLRGKDLLHSIVAMLSKLCLKWWLSLWGGSGAGARLGLYDLDIIKLFSLA